MTEEGASREVVYSTSTEGLEPDGLAGFFVGWPDPPSPETHLRLLRSSDHVVLAMDRSVGRVVGFATAISDGVVAAYVPLLEVLPEWRGRGMGSELVRRLLELLDGIYMIDVTCDPEVEGFYEGLGFVRGRAMMVRNYDRQSGLGTQLPSAPGAAGVEPPA